MGRRLAAVLERHVGEEALIALDKHAAAKGEGNNRFHGGHLGAWRRRGLKIYSNVPAGKVRGRAPMSFITRRKPIDAMAGRDGHHRLKPTLSWPHLVALGRRRHRRHRHLHPDRRRRGPGRAGGDPVLRGRRRDLRLRGPGLRRDGDHDPGVGQRLHLQLCGRWASARLDRRLEPDPRIHPGLSAPWRSAGRATRSASWTAWASHLPAALTAGPHAGGIVNLPAVFIIAAGRRPAAARHARERHGQRRAGGDQDGGPGRLRGPRPAALRRRPTSSPSCPSASRKRTTSDGVKRGVMAAAAIIFFAFYGFDAISHGGGGGQEPRPRPDHRHHRLDGGLHGDLHGGRRRRDRRACPSRRFAKSPEPLALILRELGQRAARRRSSAARRSSPCRR